MDTTISFTFNEASILTDALDIAIKTLSTACAGSPNHDKRIMAMKRIQWDVTKVADILWDSWREQNAEYTETIRKLTTEAENIKIITDHLRRDINDQAKNGIRRGEVKQEPEIRELAEKVANLEVEHPSILNYMHHIKGELASVKNHILTRALKQAKSKKVFKKKNKTAKMEA